MLFFIILFVCQLTDIKSTSITCKIGLIKSTSLSTTSKGETTTTKTSSVTEPTYSPPANDESNHILVINTLLPRNLPVLITEDEHNLVKTEINFNFSGYTFSEDGCIDIDECFQDNIRCGTNSKCTNLPGEFLCECETGYEADDEYEVDDSCKGKSYMYS